MKKITHGLQDPTTGKLFWPGPAAGSELRWDRKIQPKILALPQNYIRSFVYRDPNWEYTNPTFSFESAAAMKALDEASAKYGPVLDADNPDLRPFARHGGKMVLYHGWGDADIAPASIISFYERVVATVGGSQNHAAALNKTEEFARLFMVPGMGHCGDGEGPNSFDALGALENWVEHGKAPDRIIASRMNGGKTERTRPLCPYPQIATYKGSGSTDDAQNFFCAVPSSTSPEFGQRDR